MSVSPPQRARASLSSSDTRLADELASALAALGLEGSTELQNDLLRYLGLISKWNRVYNLSAIRDPASMLTHHLLDSLAVMPILARQSGADKVRLIDVGSGAGLPGIPLALAWPALDVHLVEPVGKKAAFLRQCAIELPLGGRLSVHAQPISRVPPLAPHHIICRAFASLADFVLGLKEQVTGSTRVWAMKGRFPHDEVQALPSPWRVADTHVIKVPGLDAERHLIELARPFFQPAE